jgi:uncharacterized protein
MRIIDFHTHLARPADTAEDPLASRRRSAYALVRERLPAGARAAVELAAGAAAPIERRLRDGWLDAIDRALALGRNRSMYLGSAGEALARRAAGLLEASFLRASRANLLAAMDEAGIDAAVVLPILNGATTEDVLRLTRSSPRLIPFCCPVPGTPAVGEQIARWKAAGCRGIKMHPTMHGRAPADSFYRDVAAAAAELDLPIVAHTGELDVGDQPEHAGYSRAGAYEPLLRDFPRARFVLAHMNLFRPDEAIEVAIRNENAFVDTSWQPAGVIARAVRRLGEHRILFASDWPFLGAHLASGVELVADALDRRPAALERVLRRNAEELLKL